MIKIKGIKIIRIILVFFSCIVAANPTSNIIEYFRGVFILSAGFCYDYYNLAQSAWNTNQFAKWTGLLAMIWSIMIFVLSVIGLAGIIQNNGSTLCVNNWLLPSWQFNLPLISNMLWVFPIAATIEVFCGRSDEIDKKPVAKLKGADQNV